MQMILIEINLDYVHCRIRAVYVLNGTSSVARVIQLLSVHGHAGGGTSAVKLTTRRKIFDLHLGGDQSWVIPANRYLIWATHLCHKTATKTLNYCTQLNS